MMKNLFWIVGLLVLDLSICLAQTGEVTTPTINHKPITAYYNMLQLQKKGANMDAVYAYTDSLYRKACSEAQQQTQAITGPLTFEFNGQQYDGFIVDPDNMNISMHWKKSGTDQPYKTLEAVKQKLDSNGQEVLMLTNGGMYLKNNIPQGLFIAEEDIQRPLDTITKAYGNFYLQPNGVFCVDVPSILITTTSHFMGIYGKGMNRISYATQSGPMLVIDGKIHSAFNHGSTNLTLRSGVGIMPNGQVVFLISRSDKTNFHDFASIFKDVFGCQNALFLDGAISKMYQPQLRPDDTGGDFGAIIAVSKPRE